MINEITNEQAIMILENMLCIGSDEKTACKMAIQALKLHPCDKIHGSTYGGVSWGGAYTPKEQPYEDMRDATEEERKSTKNYIDSISKPTGLRFDDLYEEIDFVQPHKKIPCTITIGKPSEDCISRAEALRIAESYYHTEQVVEEIRELSSVAPKTRWIPIKTRPMTEEEKDHFFIYTDSRCYDTYTMLDCPLPDDGQEVILSVNGYVSTDIFCRDSADGCYFESYDIDDVDAWMPLPQAYRKESGEE